MLVTEPGKWNPVKLFAKIMDWYIFLWKESLAFNQGKVFIIHVSDKKLHPGYPTTPPKKKKVTLTNQQSPLFL